MPRSLKDIIIDAAIEAGKIAAAERDAYSRKYDNNPKAYGHLLCATVEQGGLAPGVHNNGRSTGADEYPSQFLSPRERDRVAAARKGAPTRTAAGATPPTRESGRSDYDMDLLTPAERAAIAAAKAGETADLIAGDAPGGRPPSGRPS